MRRGESPGRDQVEGGDLFSLSGRLLCRQRRGPRTPAQGPPRPAAGARSWRRWSSRGARPVPTPRGSTPTRGSAVEEELGSWDSERDSRPGKPNGGRPGQRERVSWPPGPRQEPGVRGGAQGIRPQGPTTETPSWGDGRRTPTPPHTHWAGGGKAPVRCLSAQGRVARVLGAGRRGKALVAPRILPSLASSCHLRPGCPHRPVPAPSQPRLPKKSRGGRGVRIGGDGGPGRK